jgi:hypothetical protein
MYMYIHVARCYGYEYGNGIAILFYRYIKYYVVVKPAMHITINASYTI